MNPSLSTFLKYVFMNYVIFQSSLHTMLGHDNQSWDSMQSTASTSTMCLNNTLYLDSLCRLYLSLYFVDCLYAAAIQIWINYSFLARINNSRPCRDLNPGPLRYQANILPTKPSWLGFLVNLWIKIIKNFEVRYGGKDFISLGFHLLLTS